MAKFLIFTIVLLLVFAYVVPDNITQKIPFAPDAKNLIVNIVNQAKVLISYVTNGSFIKQIIQQSKTSAIDGVNNAKADIKDNVKQQVGEQIDKGIDRLIPTPSR